jgi:transcriptional regulator
MVDTQSNINQNITVKMKSDKDLLTLTKKLFKKINKYNIKRRMEKYRI